MKTLPPALLEEFSRKLLALMRQRGIKDNAEFARRVTKAAGWKVDRQLVHKWVNAKAYPTEQNRRVIADVLGIPAGEITYAYTTGENPAPAQLSDARVPFRWKPDPHNPKLMRAEMSDVLTVDQVEEIAAILGMTVKK